MILSKPDDQTVCRILRQAGLDPDGGLVPMRPADIPTPADRTERDAALLRAIRLL